MHIPILAQYENLGTKSGEIFLRNSAAIVRTDWMFLQMYDQIQRYYKLSDAQMDDRFGADFLTTGVVSGTLTTLQRGELVAKILERYMDQLSRGGQRTALENAAKASELELSDEDFTQEP